MKSIIQILLLLTITLNVIGQTETYVTTLGKSIVIHEDYTYDNASKEMGASVKNSSPFEMPSKEDYVMDEDELNAIANLEYDANNREIKFYLAYLKDMKSYDAFEEKVDRKSFKPTLEESKTKFKDAVQIAKKVAKLRKVNDKDRNKLYKNIYKKINQLEGRTPAIFTMKSEGDKTHLKSDTRSPYELASALDCQIVFDGFDEALDADRKETKTRHLFGYTHPRLQRHFKTGDYINTKAALAKIDGDYFLALEIDVASKSASKNYGSIEPDEKTRIRFVDGSVVFAYPINLQTGTLQEYTGHTIYKPIFKLNKSDVNLMEKMEVDDIGIMWSSGFETYEVFEVDALQNLARCLKR